MLMLLIIKTPMRHLFAQFSKVSFQKHSQFYVFYKGCHGVLRVVSKHYRS